MATKRERLFSESTALPRCQRPGTILYVEDFRSLQNGGTTAEQRGRLVDALIDYVEFEQLPDFSDDPLLAMSWGFFSQKVIRDQKTYDVQTWENRYYGYSGPIKRAGQNPLPPDQWMEQQNSGNCPGGTGGQPGGTGGYRVDTQTRTGTITGNGNGTGTRNPELEPGNKSSPGNGAGTGAGKGTRGKPPPPQYAEPMTDAEFEDKKNERIGMLAGYK